MITLSMLLIAAVLTVFIFVCVARTSVSWFAPAVPRVSRLEKALGGITDWYLGLFIGRRAFRLGRVDFGPALGIMVLVLPASALWALGRDGRLGLGAILAVILSSIWTAVAFLLAVLILLLVIRFVSMASGRAKGPETGVPSGGAGALDTLEALTDPVARRLGKAFGRGRPLSTRKAVAVAALALSVALVAGTVLVWSLGRLFYRFS